jgi:hypothetical protein
MESLAGVDGNRVMTLESEIENSALSLATDSYDMSVGEIINIYRDGDLIVSPEFQRLFRWSDYQKSHLIESLLIGVPLPSIFVFELDDRKWELIDGLQRISTILEFVGILRDADGKLYPPSMAEGTRYLPALDGVSWDGIPKGSKPIGGAQQIAIKRSRLAIQILKKSSDEKAKYDLFQRLNSHGSTATPQELRNSILYMINKEMFAMMKELSADKQFIGIMHPTDRLSQTQGLMDFITRFLVFSFVDYDKKWDVEEYLNNGTLELANLKIKEIKDMLKIFSRTLTLLVKTGESEILRRFKEGKFQGRVGQAAFETIFLGIAQNIGFVETRPDPAKFIIQRAKSLWDREDVANFTKAGLRGTDRIKATIPFGKRWFSK